MAVTSPGNSSYLFTKDSFLERHFMSIHSVNILLFWYFNMTFDSVKLIKVDQVARCQFLW